MNQIREIQRINEEELSRGIAGTSASWHAKYAHSAWCYVGNLDHKLVEGDVMAVLSEYGEIDDLHLVREEDTGKSKGFCFCKYEDARSCVLAVDNLCGVQLLGRSLRVDHVENYRLPKSLQDKEEELQQRLLEKGGLEGHAYDGVELANDFSLEQGQDLFAKPAPVKRSENNEVVDEILEQLKGSDLDAIVDKITIAFAVSVTSCPSGDRRMIQDGAAVLHQSIRLASRDSRYDYHMVAFVHPSADECVPVLKALGYEAQIRHTPFNDTEIVNPDLSLAQENSCCGTKEYLKLYSYMLTEFPVVVHLDLDCLVLRPLDDIFDLMLDLEFNRSRISLTNLNATQLPDRVDFVFTRDYGMVEVREDA